MDDLRNEHNVDLARAKGSYLEKAPGRIWEEDGWYLEQKMDGIRVSLQFGPEGTIIIGRNRQDKLKGVAQAKEFRAQNHPELQAIAKDQLLHTVLDGELTEGFKKDGTLDKYTLARIKNGDFTGFTAWACLFYRKADMRDMSNDENYNLTGDIVAALGHKKIRMIERTPATKENLAKLFKDGFEGGIAKYGPASYPKDSKTHPFWWKLKGDKLRTVDAFVVGVTEASDGGSGITGTKPIKNGLAASFAVAMYKDGKVVEVGKMSNLPVDAEMYGWQKFPIYNLRVAEMQVSGWNGKEFRFPRFVKWRPDKVPSNCFFNLQVGVKKKVK